MIIGLQKRFVFICMPKCASNSVEEMLGPWSDWTIGQLPQLRHVTFRQYDDHLKPLLATVWALNLKTVCLMREPVSWLYSWYRFGSRAQLQSPNHPNHAHSTAGLSFDEFIEGYLSPEKPAFARPIPRQCDFVCGEDGQCGVDHLFKYENLSSMVEFFEELLGAKLEMGHLNVSPQVHSRNRATALAFRAYNVTRKSIFKRTSSSEKFIKTKRPPPAIAPSLESELKDYLARDYELYESI